MKMIIVTASSGMQPHSSALRTKSFANLFFLPNIEFCLMEIFLDLLDFFDYNLV